MILTSIFSYVYINFYSNIKASPWENANKGPINL